MNTNTDTNVDDTLAPSSVALPEVTVERGDERFTVLSKSGKALCVGTIEGIERALEFLRTSKSGATCVRVHDGAVMAERRPISIKGIMAVARREGNFDVN